MTTILIKKKDTAGAPAPGDLTNAAGGTEIAVNTATKRIYTKDSGGNVVELGTNATSSTVADLTVTTSTTLSYGTANQVQYLNGSKLLVGSANMTFNGTTLTVAGLSNTGNTTLGDASADTVTVNGTITSNLIFTDNTYDIGASGATRPRTGYFAARLQVGTGVPANTQFGIQGATSTYTVGLAYIGDTSSSNTGPNTGLFMTAGGLTSGYYSNALEFDIGGGGGRARMYTSRSNAAGGTFYIDTQNSASAYYNRYYVDDSGGQYWKNVGVTTGAVGMSLTVDGLYVLNNVGFGTAASSTYKLATTVSNQVGIFVTGNTSAHSKQDLYITRASAGSTIQSGPNITMSNNANNGSWSIQVMSDGTLSLWNYLGGAWAQNYNFAQRTLTLSGGSSASADIPFYITSTNSSGVGAVIDGGGVNVKPSLLQFQQQNQGYWRIGMPQNANRMAIYGYVAATYPELFTFLEGSNNLGTLGIGTGASTSSAYSIDISANTAIAIQASRSGGTGIRLNDTVTNTWDIINQSNQLQFVRGGSLGWYFNSARQFVRLATGDDYFIDILGSYSGNPSLFRVGQTSSDGYMYVKSAAGDTTYITGYSAGTSYSQSRWAFNSSGSTMGYGRVRIEGYTDTVAIYTVNSGQDGYAWRMSGGGGTSAGIRFADVDIGGQGYGGSFIEWTRGGSYDNYLYFNIRASGNTTARRFEFDPDGTAYKSSGAGSWGALSDVRLKKNFVAVTGGLARIMQLQPKEYDFIVPSAHGDRTHERGFVAQDFEVVYPSSVTTSGLTHKDEQHLIPEGEKAKALSFNSEFYADLVDAIQTLKNEFDAYKASHP